MLHWPLPALFVPLFAHAACISAVVAPEAFIALHCSELMGHVPEAGEEAAVAEVDLLLQHELALAVFVADLVSQEAPFADDVFESSQANAALAHQAVAAMERARSRNSFMSNLPEGWNGADLVPPATPEASARVEGSLLVAHAAGVSEVQKLPDSRAGTIARCCARRLVDGVVTAP
jgi:hypothetical protein